MTEVVTPHRATPKRAPSIAKLQFAAVLGLIIIWEIVTIYVVDPIWVARPSAIAERIWALATTGDLLRHASFTIYHAVAGLALSVVIGVPIGILFGSFKTIASMFETLLLGFYSLPRIALAPLFILWFGIGEFSKIMMTFSMVVFVVILNTYEGLRGVDMELVDMMKAMRAPAHYTLRKVQLPTIVPWVARPLEGPHWVDDHRLVPSIGPHGPFEEGSAGVYRACEWGQIRRSYDSKRGGVIIGKRSSIGIQALFSAPGSPFTHPQTLKDQKIGVTFHTGSHYATLQMLEGFVKRDEIKLLNVPMDEGYEALLDGRLAAVSFMDPWISLAEKEGFQKIIETHYTGSEIASSEVDPKSWAAATRALTRAVELINADKKKYVHYIIDSLPEKYRGRLTRDDVHLPRLRYVDPSPYTREEFEQTFEWLVSWGLVNADKPFDALVDNRTPNAAAAA